MPSDCPAPEEETTDPCPGMDCASCLDYSPEDGSFCGYSDAGCQLASSMSRDAEGVVTISSMCPSETSAGSEEACVCATEWTSPGECEETQYGCPAVACDDPSEPRWCIIANDGCATDLGGYTECDDDTPVFGESGDDAEISTEESGIVCEGNIDVTSDCFQCFDSS